MKQGKKSFRHESLQDVRSIRAILKALLNGIDKGRVSFSDEEDEMLMEPKGLLHLKLRATQDEHRHRINLRISWQVDEDEGTVKKTLSVSSD
jgi:amphi-Trp domain-containing protein